MNGLCSIERCGDRVDNELKKDLEGKVVTILRCYPRICMKGSRKNTKKFSQGRSLGLDSNPGPLEY
jgi:hypothetical protein